MNCHISYLNCYQIIIRLSFFCSLEPFLNYLVHFFQSPSSFEIVFLSAVQINVTPKLWNLAAGQNSPRFEPHLGTKIKVFLLYLRGFFAYFIIDTHKLAPSLQLWAPKGGVVSELFTYSPFYQLSFHHQVHNTSPPPIKSPTSKFVISIASQNNYVPMIQHSKSMSQPPQGTKSFHLTWEISFFGST